MARMARCAAFAGSLAAGLTACANPIIQLRPVPSGAQGISLLGDTLWAAPIAPGEGPPLVRQLQAAQRTLQSKPADPAARMLVARRTAALGRIREAVELYTGILADDRGRARVYRRRGEMLFLIRELGLAERDLRRAVKSPATKVEKEFTEDLVGGLAGTSLGYRANLILGAVRYARGEFGGAVESLVEALRFSDGADELTESGLWLSIALLRAGRGAEAAGVIRGIPGNLDVRRRGPELALLRLFKGELPIDSLRILADSGPEDEALYLFGLGLVHLLRGERQAGAILFEEVLRLGVWQTWSAIAAESELARMGPAAPRR